MKMKIIPLFAVLFSFGCTGMQNSLIPVNQNCDNKFVVSDRNKIRLYEQEDEKIKLLREYSTQRNNGAVYACDKRIIVSPYYAHSVNAQLDPGGIKIFYVDSKDKKSFLIKDYVDGQLGIYNNGILLSTTLIHHARLESSEGYTPPDAIIDPEMVWSKPELFSEELVSDYKKGHKWKFFEYLHLFDLDRMEVVRSYKHSIYYGKVRGDMLYAALSDGAIASLNLLDNYTNKIFEFKQISSINNILQYNAPANHIGIFVGNTYFIVSTHRSWDMVSSRDHRESKYFKKNTIYRVGDEKLHEEVKVPFKTISYAIPVDKDIYVFNREATRIFKFNIEKKSSKQYSLPIYGQGYTVDSVGHTKQAFIIAKSNAKTGKGILFAVLKDFSKTGKVHNVSMSNISITSSQDTQTLFDRSVQ